MSVRWDPKDLPPALARLRSAEGIEGIWREIARRIYSPRVLDGLPEYVRPLAFTFWDADPTHIPRAIRDGDVGLFIAMLIRLDQIDSAMVQAGWTEADRSVVLYARYLVEAMRHASEIELRGHGALWPPQTGRAPATPTDGEARTTSRSSSRSGPRRRPTSEGRPSRASP